MWGNMTRKTKSKTRISRHLTRVIKAWLDWHGREEEAMRARGEERKLMEAVGEELEAAWDAGKRGEA